MVAIIILLTALMLIEYFLKPRFGFIRNGRILLWYGRKNRKYKVLI